MILRQLIDHESSTFTYLLGDERSRQGILIDTVRGNVERDLKLVRELELQLTHVLDTHVHADHVTGAGLIASQTGALSVAGRLGAGCAGRQVGAGDRIMFGSVELNVFETPGHTDDSLSFVVPGHVFTGDALLIRGCGRTDFQNGDPRQLYRSVSEVLFALPEGTLVHPAHDYRGMTSSTIGEEKRWNPRLAGKSAEEFVDIMRSLNLGLPAKIMEAVPANRACGLTVVTA